MVKIYVNLELVALAAGDFMKIQSLSDDHLTTDVSYQTESQSFGQCVSRLHTYDGPSAFLRPVKVDFFLG